MPPGDWLNQALYFVCSGQAFFAGVFLFLAALAVSPFVHGRVASLGRNLAVVISGFLVIISAAPLGWWLYGLMGLSAICWLFLELRKNPPSSKSLIIFGRLGALGAWLLALGLELPYCLTPTLPLLGSPKLLLIGDSISAGMSETDKRTWPKLLSQQHSVEVRDCSKMGATVKSALKQAQSLGDEPGLVLLEIGGNDLLGMTTAGQFEAQLDNLLADVCRANRTVVMLELPLPPLANRFGLAQRRLALKHKVTLIPRHILAGVILEPGATLDGIHLTPSGHQQMADTVWKLISPAYQ